VDRVLADEAAGLTDRERAFQLLVDASHNVHAETRQLLVERAAMTLTVDEVYQANMVIALFNFFNKWADLNGVKLLTPEGYAASGKRLAQYGYASNK
jgi:hypothetical protein